MHESSRDGEIECGGAEFAVVNRAVGNFDANSRGTSGGPRLRYCRQKRPAAAVKIAASARHRDRSTLDPAPAAHEVALLRRLLDGFDTGFVALAHRGVELDP